MTDYLSKKVSSRIRVVKINENTLHFINRIFIGGPLCHDISMASP